MKDTKRFRITKQRQVILDELNKVTSHPTADELYTAVRKRLPKISLGTVYRNLEMLSASGQIWKLSVGGTQKRFDGNIMPHSHIRCEVCGKVADVPIEPDQSVDDMAQSFTDFEIKGHHVEFYGLCPNCK